MLNTKIRPGDTAEWRRYRDKQTKKEKVYVLSVLHDIGTDETGAQRFNTVAKCRRKSGEIVEIQGRDLFPGGAFIKLNITVAENALCPRGRN